MFTTQYKYNKKTYSGLVTNTKKKLNTSSSEYLLISSPLSSSSSLIGNNQSNALKNINVFYTELSKHLKKDSHHMSNKLNGKSQIKTNTKISANNHNYFHEDHEIKVNSSKCLSQPQPSTQETKESFENNKKEKGSNIYMNQTRNINSDYDYKCFSKINCLRIVIYQKVIKVKYLLIMILILPKSYIIYM